MAKRYGGKFSPEGEDDDRPRIEADGAGQGNAYTGKRRTKSTCDLQSRNTLPHADRLIHHDTQDQRLHLRGVSVHALQPLADSR